MRATQILLIYLSLPLIVESLSNRTLCIIRKQPIYNIRSFRLFLIRDTESDLLLSRANRYQYSCHRRIVPLIFDTTNNLRFELVLIYRSRFLRRFLRRHQIGTIDI